MTHDRIQPLDAEEAALARDLASLSDGGPTPALDARIRAQAHAAVRRRSLRPWGIALAAVLALGVGIRMTLAPVTVQLQTGEMVGDGVAGSADPGVAGEAVAPAETAGERLPTTETTEPATLSRARAPAAEKAIGAESTTQPTAAGRGANEPVVVDSSTAAAPLPPAIATPPRVAPAQPLPAAPASLPPAVSTPSAPPPAPPQAFPAQAPAPLAPARESAPGQSEPPPTDARPMVETRRAAADPMSAPSKRQRTAEAADPAGSSMRASRSAAATLRDDSPEQRDREELGAAEVTGARRGPPASLSAPTPAPAPAAAQKSTASAGVSAADTEPDRLDQLIEDARRLHQAGDRDALHRVLRQIARDYPDRRLPPDVQRWLDAVEEGDRSRDDH